MDVQAGAALVAVPGQLRYTNMAESGLVLIVLKANTLASTAARTRWQRQRQRRTPAVVELSSEYQARRAPAHPSICLRCFHFCITVRSRPTHSRRTTARTFAAPMAWRTFAGRHGEVAGESCPSSPNAPLFCSRHPPTRPPRWP